MPNASLEQTEEKKKLNKLCAEVSAVSKDFSTSCIAAENLIKTVEAVDHDGTWSWANNEQNIGQLKSFLADMKGCIRKDWQTIMHLPMTQLRKTYGDAKLSELLIGFRDVVAPKVETLKKQRLVLLARYRAASGKS